MSRHFAVIGAVLRKDLQALWPLAALTVALLLVMAFDPQVDRLTNGFYLAAVYLLAALLIVAVVHQDSTSDVRREWLTRPIPRGDLLAAKAAFVALVLVVPVVLARGGADLANGYSVGEAILEATMIDHPVLVLVGLPALVAVAATTTTPLQAAAAATGLFAGVLLVVTVGLTSGAYAFGPEIEAFGTGWLGLATVALVTVGAAAAVLGLEYGYRKTLAARTVFLSAVALLLGVPMLWSWDDVFALQKALDGVTPPSSFGLSLRPGCLPAATVAAAGGVAPGAAATPRPVEPEISDELVAAAGPDAISFATPFTVHGVPRNWRTIVSAVDLVYLNRGGTVLGRLRPSQFSPVWKAHTGDGLEGSHYWLLPRDTYRLLAREAGVRLRLDYALGLLEPRVAAIPVDGLRREVPGIGYCRAALEGPRKRVFVDCFKHGARPALLAAEVAGRPDTRKDAGSPNYTPRWLQALSAARYALSLPGGAGATPQQVNLVAYDARFHFIFGVTAPGILGGDPTACPAPAP